VLSVVIPVAEKAKARKVAVQTAAPVAPATAPKAAKVKAAA